MGFSRKFGPTKISCYTEYIPTSSVKCHKLHHIMCNSEEVDV